MSERTTICFIICVLGSVVGITSACSTDSGRTDPLHATGGASSSTAKTTESKTLLSETEKQEISEIQPAIGAALVAPADLSTSAQTARAFLNTQSENCPAYSESAIYKDRSTTVIVSPDSDWVSTIENARTGTEILLEDGIYALNQYTVQVQDGVSIRGLSGNRDNVRIVGSGYREGSEGFMIRGNDIAIADLSIANLRDHAISVQPGLGALDGLQLYNLSITDIGTQHIKVNPGGARNGLIACSDIGYSIGGAVGDYNGAIDLHETIDWTIRDNFIYNINGDGSGCIVDQECGQYISAPAIYAWRGAQGTRVIRNNIVDSFRNIALGMGSSHTGGLVAHNRIIQSTPGDAGIELYRASAAIVEFNVVQLSGDYPGAIEYRNSINLSISNNSLSGEPWDRGGNVNLKITDNTDVATGTQFPDQ